MKINKVIKLIPELKPEHLPVLLVGNSGVGKTSAVAQGAKLAGRTLAAIPPLSTMLPEDAGGIPVPNLTEKVVSFLPPDFWRVDSNALIFLDELTLARPDVLSALCPVLVPMADGKRRIGSLVIPESTLVIAAAMPITPGTMTRPLPVYLRSRLRIINVAADSESWISWATINGINPKVVAYIHARPNMLAPDMPVDNQLTAFASPRGWQSVSEILNMHLDDDAEFELVAGAIGSGSATEFFNYIKNIGQLPNIIDLLTGKADLPKEPSAAIATMAAVTTFITEQEDRDIANLFLARSVNWKAEYVVGIIFPAIKQMPERWRVKTGMYSTALAVNNPEWFNKFSDLLSVGIN